jgi:hypothetical protein
MGTPYVKMRSIMALQPYGDNFIPIIPVDYAEHTPVKPFCWNDGCDCREDQEAIAELNQQFQDGLASRNDVDDIYHGRTI